MPELGVQSKKRALLRAIARFLHFASCTMQCVVCKNTIKIVYNKTIYRICITATYVTQDTTSATAEVSAAFPGLFSSCVVSGNGGSAVPSRY